MRPPREQIFADFAAGHSLLRLLRGLKHHQPLAERGRIGVDGHDLPLGIAVHQVDRRHRRGLRRAADAAGHTDIEHIVARAHGRFKKAPRGLRVYHRGLDGRAIAHGVVKLRAVEVRILGIDHLSAVDGVGKGDDGDMVPFEQRGGQIRRGIGKQSEHGDRSLPNNARNSLSCPTGGCKFVSDF